MEWYLHAFKNYAVFTGRARRTEFWMFILFSFIASIVLSIVEWIIGVSFLSFLYSLAVLIPSLAVGARRLHDTGRSGWLQLLVLIPLIGAIILIVFYCEDSHGENQYGPSPK